MRGSLREILLLFCLGLGSLQAGAETFTVTTTEQEGQGSLALAVTLSNVTPGRDRIVFNIPGIGPHVIFSADQTHTLSDPVEIDGYTQPGSRPNTRAEGSDAVLNIELDGTGSPFFRGAFAVSAPDVTIRGVAMHGFGGIAVGTSGLFPVGDDLVIEGCYFGLRADGSLPPFPGRRALQITQGNRVRIGGDAAAARNVVAGMDEDTVVLAESLVTGAVVNNYVGVGPDGNAALPGRESGILLTTGNGTIEVRANRVAHFAEAGIEVSGGNARLERNQTFGNDGAGIDLNPDGPGFAPDGLTPNDDDDVDFGPNALQNFPVLTAVLVDAGSTTANGTLERPDGTATYRIELFASPDCDSNGHGEGAVPLGAADVDFADDNDTFALTLPVAAPAETAITATATDALGRTSEYSACVFLPRVRIFADGFEAD